MASGMQAPGAENTVRPLWYRLGLSLAFVIALVLAGSGVADRAGYDYVDAGLKRALITFAAARGLNAVISVAQGTEVAVQPAGMGVNFAPGEVLDPINDLVEQFSWVMLAAATSLGIQKLLLTAFTAAGVTVVLAAGVAALLLTLWWQRVSRWHSVALRLALVLFALRFAVPVAALAGEAVYDALLSERYVASTQAIEKAAAAISSVNRTTQNEAAVPEDASVLERAKRFYESAAAAVNVRAYVERYQAAAEDVSEHVVDLIVVFLIQTVLLPLVFLLLIYKLIGRALRAG